MKAKYFNWFCWIAAITITLYYTAIHNHDLLVTAQELSLFLPTATYFGECMTTAGGLLIYLGTFFTQFFYYPLLGSMLFLLMMVTIAFGCIKAFRLRKENYPLALIPGLMLLLSLTQLDYIVFILKSPGYFFSNGIGVLLTVYILWGCRKLKPVVKNPVVILMPVILYPLLGFYGLFTAAIAAVEATQGYNGSKDKSNKKRTVKPALILLLSGLVIALTPYLYYASVYTDTTLPMSYLCGLPRFNFNKTEAVFWLPFAVIFLLILFFNINIRIGTNKIFNNFRTYAAALFTLFCVLCIPLLSNNNRNFRTEVSLNLAAINCDWEKIVQTASTSENPTRLIVMYHVLALQRMGQAGDRMFSFIHSSTPQVAHRNSQYLRDVGAIGLFYYYGRINNSYRWCMEDKVEFGMKVIYLKYMFRCALLNGETELVRKYADILSQTWFHRKWVERYGKFIDQPDLMIDDPEFRQIRPLMAFDNLLLGDNGMLENYLLNSFAYMEGGPPELVEVSLQCNLIQKNIANFWPRFFLYYRTHERIPKHYQEAALLYVYLERNVGISSLRFDQEVLKRFKILIKLSQQYSYMTQNRQAIMLRPKFGDTFWYYYFFVQGLKTS
jgi:hypothetical protein